MAITSFKLQKDDESAHHLYMYLNIPTRLYLSATLLQVRELAIIAIFKAIINPQKPKGDKIYNGYLKGKKLKDILWSMLRDGISGRNVSILHPVFMGQEETPLSAASRLCALGRE